MKIFIGWSESENFELGTENRHIANPVERIVRIFVRLEHTRSIRPVN